MEVLDNGVGIPKSEQRNIFQKFFRSDRARKAQPDGSGLGLYIVKKTAELLGGKVWFESEVGKGTTFYVELPLKYKAKINFLGVQVKNISLGEEMSKEVKDTAYEIIKEIKRRFLHA